MSMREVLRIRPEDTVGVALRPLDAGARVSLEGAELVTRDDIPAGHKVALKNIAAGEKAIKYGFPIGQATRDIPAGGHVHVHNLKTLLSGELAYEYRPAARPLTPLAPASFPGYPRADGRVGVRNELWILPTVGCVNDVARALERRAQALVGGGVEGVYAFPHPYGCSQMGEDQENTRKILAALAAHPNAGGVLVLPRLRKQRRGGDPRAHGQARAGPRAFFDLPAGGGRAGGGHGAAKGAGRSDEK